MRRTKKEFIAHYDEKYITVEFYHGERSTFFSGCGMEKVTETAVKCSIRGGVCFTLPEKYKSAIWKMIDEYEREMKHRIGLDFFKANVPAYVNDVNEATTKN